jgi:transporter family-2 protein
MDRNVALAAAVAIGGVVALQAPLNSALGRLVGGTQASVVALAISCVCLAALSAFYGGFSGLARLGDAPLHVAIGGGLIGALYVGSIVFTVRELGAGGLTAATISGQLAIATAIDHFGWLGVTRSPVTAAKLAGLAFLAFGTYLVVRD